MLSAFAAGFTNELVKTAGLRDVVRRVVHGKPIPKMGFFQRRRVAKALGVKPSAVERVLMDRQRKDRLTRGLIAGGSAVGGAVAGEELSKKADAMVSSGSSGASPQYTPDQENLLARRDALMKSRAGTGPAAMSPWGGGVAKAVGAAAGGVSKPPAPPPTPKYTPDQEALLARRDALMKSRQGNDELLRRRDALMKSRQTAIASR